MSSLQMKYFVLKPAGDDAYARAARKALQTYSLEITGENPSMANDMWKWAVREENAHHERGEALASAQRAVGDLRERSATLADDLRGLLDRLGSSEPVSEDDERLITGILERAWELEGGKV